MTLTSLEEKIRKTILTDLEKIDIVNINTYALYNKDTIAYAYGKKIIDDEAIEEALKNAAIIQARKDYSILTDEKRKNIYGITHADHAQRNDCFAYAIEKEIFTKKELYKIYFDHGQNPEIYVKEYGREDIGKSLREELLDPRERNIFKKKSDGDEHPICSCGK
jgi:hypothetical protein